MKRRRKKGRARLKTKSKARAKKKSASQVTMTHVFTWVIMLFSLGVAVGMYQNHSWNQLPNMAWFKIKHINVTLEPNVPQRAVSQRIQQVAQRFQGQAFFGMNPENLKQHFDPMPEIRLLRFQRIFPNQLNITAVMYQPVMMVQLDKLYLVDVSGEIYKAYEGEENPLPILTFSDHEEFKPHLLSNAVLSKKQAAIADQITTGIEFAHTLNTHARALWDHVSEIQVSRERHVSTFMIKHAEKVSWGSSPWEKKASRYLHILKDLEQQPVRSMDLNYPDRAYVRI